MQFFERMGHDPFKFDDWDVRPTCGFGGGLFMAARGMGPFLGSSYSGVGMGPVQTLLLDAETLVHEL